MSITLHMVTSLDGFACKENNDIAWMDATWGTYDKGVEMNADILKTIDCYIMGSHTYELALQLGWPYGETHTIVVTSRNLPDPNKNVEFYASDLKALAQQNAHKNAWLVGGPLLCQEFLKLNLVNEVCLTIVPIVLGEGISLFKGSEHKLQLKEMTAFKNGMIDLWYQVIPAES